MLLINYLFFFFFLFFNRWSAIAARLPGRTDNEIKNYWNTHIRKRLLRMGIDPVTHSPRLDLLDLSSILSSQMNMARFLGAHSQQQQQQTLVNPDELIRLATSLMSSSSSSSSHQYHHQNFYLQNDHQNQLYCGGSNTSPHLQQLIVQNNQFIDHDHQIQACPTNLEATSFNSPSSQTCEWQSCNNSAVIPNYYSRATIQEDSNLDQYVPVLPCYSNLGCFGAATTSVLSTPSSSPATALNSNSTTTTYLEDESYSSDVLKFENISDISDIFDVNYELM